MAVSAETLAEYLRKGELEWLEFKAELNLDKQQDPPTKGRSTLLKDLVALANAKHQQPQRYLLVGVRDNGDIVGYTGKYDDAMFQEWVGNTFEPPIKFVYRVVEVGGKNIGVFEIDKFQRQPHIVKRDLLPYLHQGQLWYRQGTKNTIALHGALQDYFYPCPELKLSFTKSLSANPLELHKSTLHQEEMKATRRSAQQNLTSLLLMLQEKFDHLKEDSPLFESLPAKLLPEFWQHLQYKETSDQQGYLALNGQSAQKIVQGLQSFGLNIDPTYLTPKLLAKPSRYKESLLPVPGAISSTGIQYIQALRELKLALLNHQEKLRDIHSSTYHTHLKLALENLGTLEASNIKVEIQVQAPHRLEEIPNSAQGGKDRAPHQFIANTAHKALVQGIALSPDDSTQLSHIRVIADSYPLEITYTVTASNLPKALKGTLKIT